MGLHLWCVLRSAPIGQCAPSLVKRLIGWEHYRQFSNSRPHAMVLRRIIHDAPPEFDLSIKETWKDECLAGNGLGREFDFKRRIADQHAENPSGRANLVDNHVQAMNWSLPQRPCKDKPSTDTVTDADRANITKMKSHAAIASAPMYGQTPPAR